MKRAGHLFAMIADPGNLRHAFHAAAKSKRAKADVLAYRERLDVHLEHLRHTLLAGTVAVGGYRQFKVYEPKERVITVAPFAQRVLHHAIMRVCEPVFERHLIHHTYACRKGKGRIAALDAAERLGRTHPHYLKLDIRKYFDSVDHGILKCQLRRLFKDKALLQTLDSVIDSFCVQPGKGLPIGNLTSQHFANFYLSQLDHFVSRFAPARVFPFLRYMDDMVVWGSDPHALAELRKEIRAFLRSQLALELKQERIGAVAQGVPFLGCKLFAGYHNLNARSKRRFRRKMNLFDRLLHEGRIDEAEAQQRSLAVCAFAKTASSHNFRRQVLEPHFRATAMGETVAPTATFAAARGTTTRTTPPSPTGTTTTRTTGTTTTASGWPAAPERSRMRPLLPEPAVFQPPKERISGGAKPSNPPSAPVGRVDSGSTARTGALGAARFSRRMRWGAARFSRRGSRCLRASRVCVSPAKARGSFARGSFRSRRGAPFHAASLLATPSRARITFFFPLTPFFNPSCF